MTSRRGVTPILLSLVLAASACDDPAPIVLGRLRAPVGDSGESMEDGDQAHEPVHDHEEDHDEEEEHDAEAEEHAERFGGD